MQEYAELELPRGYVTLIDVDDWEWAAQYRWHVNSCGYVARNYWRDRRCYYQSLHRALMGEPEGLQVDHINHNPLDNRRENLRVVTQEVNGQNRKGPPRGSKTGFMGVRWNPKSQRYTAQVQAGGRYRYLGSFTNLAAAVEASRIGRLAYAPGDVTVRPGDPAMADKRVARHSSTGIRGVNWHAASRKYAARMQIEGREYWIGIFATVEEAEAAVVEFRKDREADCVDWLGLAYSREEGRLT